MNETIENPETAFVHMLVERQNNCEQKIEQFISQNTISDLFLRPDTAYQYFNDGFRLLWTLFDSVRLRSPSIDGNRLIDIDDIHADAILLDHGALFRLPVPPEDNNDMFYIGHPLKPLILKDFIRQVESCMRYHDVPGTHIKWCDTNHHNQMLPIQKFDFTGLFRISKFGEREFKLRI